MHLVLLLLLLLLDLIVVVGLIGFIVVIIMMFYPFDMGTSPFVPTRTEALKEIIQALRIEKGSIVYDLGCGDGKVLAACYEAQPNARYIGIDKKPLPYYLSLRRLKKMGKPPQIVFKRADFLKEDINDATHIFMYLMPSVVKKIEPHLLQVLKPGTRIVSCDFKFHTRQPDAVIDLHVTKHSRCRKLLVYTV